jgi:hypothetical protein
LSMPIAQIGNCVTYCYRLKLLGPKHHLAVIYYNLCLPIKEHGNGIHTSIRVSLCNKTRANDTQHTPHVLDPSTPPDRCVQTNTLCMTRRFMELRQVMRRCSKVPIPPKHLV